MCVCVRARVHVCVCVCVCVCVQRERERERERESACARAHSCKTVAGTGDLYYKRTSLTARYRCHVTRSCALFPDVQYAARYEAIPKQRISARGKLGCAFRKWNPMMWLYAHLTDSAVGTLGIKQNACYVKNRMLYDGTKEKKNHLSYVVTKVKCIT